MSIVEFPALTGYQLIKQLGSGRFGTVYLARQTGLASQIAVKVISPELSNQPDFIRRFESKATTIARLEHPHITPVIDYWRDPHGAYLVMHFLHGGSVRDALSGSGPFSLSRVARLLDQVTGALDFAHRSGIIHGNIKPGNILLDEDGNAYLTDFDIAGVLTVPYKANIQDDLTVGFLDYLSPEQIRGEAVSSRTDIYSLGILLYEMITGEYPFTDTLSVEQRHKHITDPLPPIQAFPATTSDNVNTVIARATALEPGHRYDDVLAMAAAFNKAIGQEATPSTVVEQLTLREQEILDLIASGKSNREIAQALVVTLSTVKWHIRQLYSKLGVHSRVQAILRARQLDLIVTGDADGSVMPGSADDLSPLSMPEPENPYKGLRAFQVADALDFFGREEVTDKLIQRMASNEAHYRFLAIIGPSGSGKSSLVHAGLIPNLWQGSLPGSERWFIAEIIPGSHPLDKLETALIRVATNKADDLREQLQRDEHGLLRAADLILPDTKTELVVIVDQLEEVFTLVADERQRKAFLDLLLTAVSDEHSRVRVIVTLRADYYDRPLHYSEFADLLRSRMETVLPLTVRDLECAIRSPAERVGVRFEEGLVAQIVSDMNHQVGALPLLQYALTELFDRRQGRVMTHAAYCTIGGAVGSLATRAEAIFADLPANDQALARQIFIRLVTLGEGAEDTRRRALLSELMALASDPDRVEEIIDQFTTYRLLSLDHEPETRQPTVEVAHEAILREWERLREWINTARTELRLQRQLSILIADWHKAGEEPSYLLRGARLAQFEDWTKTTSMTLTQSEKSYLQASIEARERQQAIEEARQAHEATLERRARRVFQVLSIVLLVAAVGGTLLAIFAFDQEARAQSARAEAVRANDAVRVQRDNARDLALVNGARAAFVGGDHETALALAVAANERPAPSAMAQTLLSKVAYIPGTTSILDDDFPGGKLALSTNGTRLLAVDYSGRVRIWDMTTREVLYESTDHSNTIVDVDIHPNGKIGFTTDTGHNILLWDVENGTFLREIDTDSATLGGGEVFSGAFGPNGNTLITNNAGRAGFVEDEETALIEWYLDTGEVRRVLRGPEAMITKVAISPDGSALLSGGYGYQFTLWDYETGEIIRQSPVGDIDPYGAPSDIQFLPGGERALALYMDMTAVLIDIQTLDVLQTYGKEHTNWEWADMALSPDGETVFFRNIPNGLALYDVDSGQVTETLPQDFVLYSLAATPDYRTFILATGSQVRLHASGNGAEAVLAEVPKTPWPMQLSPAGNELLVVSITIPGDRTDCAYTFLDPETGEIIRQFGPEDDPIHTLGCENLKAGWNRVSFTPDGKYGLSGTPNGGGVLWDVQTGEIVVRLQSEYYGVSWTAVSPDGQMALTAPCASPLDSGLCRETHLVLWDLNIGETIWQVTVPSEHVTNPEINFSHDGRHIFVPDGSRALIFDTDTGEIIGELASDQSGIGYVAFNPDGTQAVTLVNRDGLLTLWDLKSKRQIWSVPPGTVNRAIFSPDGKYVVTSSGMGDGIRIFDVATGEEIRRYSEGYINLFPVFTPDGKHLLVVDPEGSTVRRIRMDWDDALLSWTRDNRYVRDLTCTERALYGIEPLCDAP